MFRHQGKARTYRHNLHIATLLSLVAGIVNVVGFLAIGRLTTNVTGHFALFIDDVSRKAFFNGLIFLVYILSFLGGAFISGFLVDFYKSRKSRRFVLPVIIEAVFLLALAFFGNFLHAHFIACSLLFAMGMQNALVTRISNAVVRTTHLTGLFTDLGIELSQLIFKKEQKLIKTIWLRVNIIFSFFFGGLAGGFFYSHFGLPALSFAAALLFLGLIVDHLRFKRLKRKRKRVSKGLNRSTLTKEI